jgi:hypothetical protein
MPPARLPLPTAQIVGVVAVKVIASPLVVLADTASGLSVMSLVVMALKVIVWDVSACAFTGAFVIMASSTITKVISLSMGVTKGKDVFGVVRVMFIIVLISTPPQEDH